LQHFPLQKAPSRQAGGNPIINTSPPHPHRPEELLKRHVELRQQNRQVPHATNPL